MKSIVHLVISFSILAMISCGECEDKTLEISDTLKAFIPYEGVTNITMVNGQNMSKDFTISPDLDISTDNDGDCTTTSIKPYFTINTNEQEEFMRIWASFNEDFIADNEQFWFIIDDVDGSILESGMIREPLLSVGNVSINGNTFEDVISIVTTRDQNTTIVYMQREVGIIGYEMMDETWVIQ